MDASVHVIDYVIFCVVIVGSLLIGVYYSFSQKSSSEYLQGRRQLGLLPVSISMMVSFISAVTMQASALTVITMSDYFTLIFRASPIFRVFQEKCIHEVSTSFFQTWSLLLEVTWRFGLSFRFTTTWNWLASFRLTSSTFVYSLNFMVNGPVNWILEYRLFFCMLTYVYVVHVYLNTRM